jgi:hypothetical protein
MLRSLAYPALRCVQLSDGWLGTTLVSTVCKPVPGWHCGSCHAERSEGIS